MGIFDLFGRDPKTKNERVATSEFDERLNYNTENKSAPMAVYSPTGYADVEKIIDELKSGKTVMVHLEELKTETAIHVLDMLSGAIYALGGGVYEMNNNIFMFSPSGVEVKI